MNNSSQYRTLRVFVTAIALVLLGGLCGAFVAHFFFSPTPIEVVVPAAGPGNQISDNHFVQEVQNVADNAFGKAIATMNFGLALLVIFITLFGIAFGFQFFSRQTEYRKDKANLRKALRQVQMAPAQLVNSFYKEQLKGLHERLTDSNHIKRSIAIKTLESNPELTPDQYEDLHRAAEAEIESRGNFYQTQNLIILLTLMFGLSPSNAAKDLIRLIDSAESRAPLMLYILIQYLVTTDDESAKNKVKQLLVKGKQVGFQVANALWYLGLFSIDWGAFVAEQCPDEVFSTAYSIAQTNAKVDVIESMITNKHSWSTPALAQVVAEQRTPFEQKMRAIEESLINNSPEVDAFLRSSLPNLLFEAAGTRFQGWDNLSKFMDSFPETKQFAIKLTEHRQASLLDGLRHAVTNDARSSDEGATSRK